MAHGAENSSGGMEANPLARRKQTSILLAHDLSAASSADPQLTLGGVTSGATVRCPPRSSCRLGGENRWTALRPTAPCALPRWMRSMPRWQSSGCRKAK
jgi:hypothetical protein